MYLRRLITLTILLFCLLPLQAQAQAPAGDGPVVYAVLFYSPSCPHCHTLLQNDWPPIQAEFGDQLQVLLVNTQTQGGAYLYTQAYDAFGPPDGRRGVPMMIIDDQMLMGGYDIPTQAPGIIRAGLADGGLPVPAVPGLHEAFAEALGVSIGTEAGASTAASAENALATVQTTPNLWDTLRADPIANGAALLLLLGLIASVGLILWQWVRQRPLTQQQLVADGLMLAAVLVVLSLLFNNGTDLVALAAALVSGLALLAAALLRLRNQNKGLVIFVLSIAGLVVAAYLSYIEIGQTQAACGLVGDCNAVQQSPYAYLFGLIPVGLLGIVGYVAIGLTLLWQSVRPGPLVDVLLFGMALFGTVFSVYLTALELFVIGATCMWCVLSAVLMLALLWLTADAGLQALRNSQPMTKRPQRAS